MDKIKATLKYVECCYRKLFGKKIKKLGDIILIKINKNKKKKAIKEIKEKRKLKN